ncbi:MAG: PAS domain S-box protein, partial [Ignavibacteria bacterium]
SRWFHNRCFPREGGGISVYFSDITERKNAEKKMIRQTSVLYGINKIFQSSFSAGTVKELGILCLEAAEEITQSKSGFIAELNDKEELSFIAVNNSSGNSENYNSDLKNSGLKEIYDPIIKEGKGFYINDLALRHDAIVIPGYSSTLDSFLGVPLIHDYKVFGMIAVGNRKGGYTGEELESLEAIGPAVVEACQRKRLEQDLRISEEKTRNLIKFAPAGIYEIDFHTKSFKSVNDVMCEYLGYTREELLSINAYDILDDEGKLTFRKRIAQYLAGEKADTSVEYKVKAKDGREYYAVLNVTINYKDGKPEGAFVIAHDVTERKRAEQALQESEKRYRRLVQDTTAVILRINPLGIIRFANERALEFFGYTEDELIGKHAVGTIVPEKESTGRSLSEMVNNILKNPDQFHSNINENMCRNGRRVWLEWTNSGIYDKDGNLVEFLSVGIDITERRKAEQAYEESRKKYQALIETTNDFIWEIDASGRYTYCSPQMEKLWGFKQEAMIGKTPFDAMHKNNREIMRDFFINRINSPSPFSGLESAAYDSLGKLIFIETSGVPFFDEKGKFLGYRGITRDISKRKKAEEQLERTNQKINEILNSIQDDFYVLDRNWNFVFASRQFTSRIGIEPKDLVGKNFWEMFPKHLGSTLEKNFREGMETREIRRFEMSGKYTNAYYRMTVFPSAEGITVLGNDITEQRKIEEVLQESEERFRAIFERSTVGKMLINKDRLIVETNQAFANMLGYTITELQKVDVLNITHPDDFDITLKAYRSVIASERESIRFEKRYLHKDGRPIWSEFSFTLMRDANGSPLYFIANIIDISERKKAEEALQKALAEKEMLMRELQHRVKNSLSTAVSLIGLEQDNFTDKHMLAILSNTETRLRTMAMLYDELNQSNSLASIDICNYIQTVVDTLSKAYLTPAGPVKIESRIASIELEPKRAMPLGLIVNELVINAFKYAFPMGRAGVIKIELTESGNTAKLCVTDNGIGFAPPDKLVKGSRLGLRLVEILSEQLAGKMTIKSKKGVTVCVAFEK